MLKIETKWDKYDDENCYLGPKEVENTKPEKEDSSEKEPEKEQTNDKNNSK